MSAGHLHQNDVGHFLSVQSLSAPRDPTLKAMLIGLRNAEVFLCDSENLFCFLFLIILTLTGQTGWQQTVCEALVEPLALPEKNRYLSKGIQVTEGFQYEGKQVVTLLNACSPVFSPSHN